MGITPCSLREFHREIVVSTLGFTPPQQSGLCRVPITHGEHKKTALGSPVFFLDENPMVFPHGR
ncbi:hypothetical protein HNQ08_004382 [Deinococcus humi]|uniref:Uncharacterized protein n=1 Tax=Deinococcus humi TaxID=662880 RepID=A0A7W8K0L3_9DEIO|nr:hypothetical protein [Deinococcus humi]